MSETIGKKIYYSIGEACDLIGVKPHVLRYWETQFPEIRPMKNRQGHRIYKAPEISLVIFVRHLLYHEKHSIEEARRVVAEMEGSREGAARVKAAVAPAVLATMRRDLLELRQSLEAPTGDGS